MTSERIHARVTRRIAAPPERVFEAWLDERTIRRWMASALREHGLPGDLRRVEVDARVGGTFTFSDVRDEGEAVHWGRYLAIDRPRELVFTWFTSADEEREDASRVALTLAADGDGSSATIVHEMHPKWADHVERAAESWGRMLSHVGHALDEAASHPAPRSDGEAAREQDEAAREQDR
jgi:uncharacterized protein YndB with AHSA1/START domain